MGNMGAILALLGAVVAAPFVGVGSAIGVGITDQAATGVATEDPNGSSRVLVLQLPPGTQGVYGLLIAFIILTQIGIVGGSAGLSLVRGILYLAVCFPMGIAGWTSGTSQGKIAAASIDLVARRPEQFDKTMIFPAMVGTYAILTLLISILSIFGTAGLNI